MLRLIKGWPVAIIGSGHAGIAAVINTLVEIATTRTSGADVIKVLVVDTKNPQPELGAPYPMNGINPDDLHPFMTPRPPPGFVTYGEYVRRMADALEGRLTDLGEQMFDDALENPTYQSISLYLEDAVERAITAAVDKVDVVTDERQLSDVRLDRQSGLARVEYADGSHVLVLPVVAERPPHMGG